MKQDIKLISYGTFPYYTAKHLSSAKIESFHMVPNPKIRANLFMFSQMGALVLGVFSVKIIYITPNFPIQTVFFLPNYLQSHLPHRLQSHLTTFDGTYIGLFLPVFKTCFYTLTSLTVPYSVHL